MNRTRSSQVYWTAALWTSLAIITSFYMLGAIVNVPWGNTDIPLSQVVASIEWNKAFSTYSSDEWHLVFFAALCCAVFYSFTSSWRLRLVTMLVGFASPLALVDPEIAITIFFGPFVLITALTGRANGEFYVEDMPESAAVGLWLLLCSVFAFRELCLAIGHAKRAYAEHILAEAQKDRIANA